MKTKHTVGPWIFDETIRDGREKGFVRSTVLFPGADRGASVCKVTTVLGSDVMEANARLIASAPELLEALNEIVASGVNVGCYSGRFAKALEQARIALKKATL